MRGAAGRSILILVIQQRLQALVDDALEAEAAAARARVAAAIAALGDVALDLAALAFLAWAGRELRRGSAGGGGDLQARILREILGVCSGVEVDRACDCGGCGAWGRSAGSGEAPAGRSFIWAKVRFMVSGRLRAEVQGPTGRVTLASG